MNTLKDVQKCIGIEFKDEALLKLAVTHSSYINEFPEIAPNQREVEAFGWM